MKRVALALAVLLAATPAFAQFGGALDKLKKGKEGADRITGELTVSEQDERSLGEEVSETVRKEFGVFQDAGVTKYVTLVGTVLVRSSSRPDLKWEFIVLDTDAVNAFAAPGGIVHITRGALGLIRSEAELAGVLAHEISHVTRRHTANAITKNKAIKLGADAAGKREHIRVLAGVAYDNIVEKGFDRSDEHDADQEGIRLANRAGYNPSGLATFLTKLMERNRGESDRNGLFASHPETRDRVASTGRQIKTERLNAPALVEARYLGSIRFTAKPLADIAVVAPGTRGVAGGGSAPRDTEGKSAKKEEPQKKGFGLGLLNLTKSKQSESTQVSASAGGRAVGSPDRHARGGENPSKVHVTITAAEVAAFKSGIA
jgi:predicted Zn-dependent protease